MSLQRFIPEDDFETFTLETHPKRTYSSGSNMFDVPGGITGSVYLYAQRSKYEKEVYSNDVFSSPMYTDHGLELLRQTILSNSSSTNINSSIETYISSVNEIEQSERKKQQLEIYRFKPGFELDSDFLRKSTVVNQLLPYYRTRNHKSHFAFTNYNCLNFFTSDNFSSSSALLYPNPVSGSEGSNYQLDKKFTFSFFIKPQYTTENDSTAYHAGSILHLTGSYCLSLHSGSSKDGNGLPNKFRIALALSNSADISPSLLDTSDPYTVWSTDNSLEIDKWNHVAIRWSSEQNYGTGSVYVNRELNNVFTITESLSLGTYENDNSPSVLILGNYYEGENQTSSALERFFATDTATREGLEELVVLDDVFSPTNYSLSHPLNAELHDIMIFEKYLTKNDILSASFNGPNSIGNNNLRFFVPPFFTEESPYQKSLNDYGGELITPFQTQDASTYTPFAGKMAFSVGGHYINLENYTRDFATGNYPRLWELSGSSFTPSSTTTGTANEFLYTTGSVCKRLYTVLPCDDGNFVPNFNLLTNMSSSRFVNDLGNKDLGIVTLRDIVPNYLDGRTVTTTGSIQDSLVGVSPTNIDAIPGDSLAILNRVRDNSSNQVVLFDISNIFYGMRINPNSVTITDPFISASEGKVGITLKDDGMGNLYRCNINSKEKPAKWAQVGNVFYEEGIILIKYPQLYFFGEHSFDIEFEGVQNIHVMSMYCTANPLQQTESSNPSYEEQIDSNENANKTDNKYVWITGINIHDDNLNVIARTNMAQSIKKYSGDKMKFKIKIDF